MKICIYIILLCSSFVSRSQELFDIEKVGIAKEIEELNSLIAQSLSAENYYYRGFYNYEKENYLNCL